MHFKVSLLNNKKIFKYFFRKSGGLPMSNIKDFFAKRKQEKLDKMRKRIGNLDKKEKIRTKDGDQW